MRPICGRSPSGAGSGGDLPGAGSFTSAAASCAPHLPASPRIAVHISPGGALLLTVGPDEGEFEGRVEGDAAPHASLSAKSYAEALDAAGMADEAFVPYDPDRRGRSLPLAVRPPAKEETS